MEPRPVARREVKILGAPMDLGANRRGTDMGPSALRVARLQSKLEKLGHSVEDLGNVFSPTVETKVAKHPGLYYLDEIVQVCETIARRVEKVAASGQFPLVLGGDHSCALGTVGGLVRAGGRVGVVWVDAHTDFNTTETTETGNIHGMPLASLCGIGDPRLVDIAGPGAKLRPDDVSLVGIRDVDREEARLLKKAGVGVWTMRDIDERGMKRVMAEAIDRATANADRLHISLDVDSIDPAHAPGVGTAVPGGLSFREAHLGMELVAESPKFGSMEVVEVNPLLDEKNRTAELATDLVASALGKRILWDS
ncbi:MAG TPA: arginase [Candidatus Thermoplasmatota archaeon]|nr:arginase [Candidatus Thermoplasmatota archaeon]